MDTRDGDAVLRGGVSMHRCTAALSPSVLFSFFFKFSSHLRLDTDVVRMRLTPGRLWIAVPAVKEVASTRNMV